MVSKEDGMFTKNSYMLHKHNFFLFSRFMIRWQKKRANTFTRQISPVPSPALVSDWPEYLIHIHGKSKSFAHFKLLVDE